MDITDIRKLKKETEDKIVKLILDFSRKSELDVIKVFTNVYRSPQDKRKTLNAFVRLDCKL